VVEGEPGLLEVNRRPGSPSTPPPPRYATGSRCDCQARYSVSTSFTSEV
jgi:hypothetical protein